MQCPNPTCHSTSISSQHFSDHALEKVAHVTHGGHHFHLPIVTFGGIALFGVMKMINSLRSAWRCDRCGATFDA